MIEKRNVKKRMLNHQYKNLLMKLKPEKNDVSNFMYKYFM